MLNLLRQEKEDRRCIMSNPLVRVCGLPAKGKVSWEALLLEVTAAECLLD